MRPRGGRADEDIVTKSVIVSDTVKESDPYHNPNRVGVCRHYQQRGECGRGNACRFSHEGVGGGRGYGRVRGGRGVCYKYPRGECLRGDACRFSHEGVGGGRGRGVCYKYPLDECLRGTSCQFSHDGDRLR